MSFDDQDIEDWLDLLGSAPSWQGFDYIVTPNVDHVISYHDGDFAAEAYDAARFRICDSRILSKLAGIKGLALPALPGSDLVREFLSAPQSRCLRIAVFGPSEEDHAILVGLYPALELIHIPAPMGLNRGTPAWDEAIAALDRDAFDVLLCCVSFPKQELICHDLKASGHDHGLAICAGASLDFLTGRQTRAPRTWQKLHMEWLYRLLSDPRRLLGRYAKGLKIFRLLRS